jgi:glyoxylase-like metal-dependent hydrolase (beta-lactamase superfamily II)
MASSIQSFSWIHGSPDCAGSTDPPLQTFQLDPATFILRQSKCLNFEAPFLYLLIGSHKALLLDTGAESKPGHPCPVQETVRTLLRRWQSDNVNPELELIVAHSHSHGDHVAGDDQFRAQPNTTLIRPALDDVKAFFDLPDWPDGNSSLDLGKRLLTIFPLPGHEGSHIAIYDANTRVLLTGDTLYPGLLTVEDWGAYRRSVVRLMQFTVGHAVSMVLGAHIEMKRTPRQMYRLGTTFQPDEHGLPLMAEHIQRWYSACEAMGANPHRNIQDDFIIAPL